MSYRVALLPLVALVLNATVLAAQEATSKAIHACYVPLTGTVYRIMESRLPSSCVSDEHVPFSWTDGEGAMRVSDAAGGDLSGDFPDPVVNGLRGHPVADVAPNAGDVLVWDGTAWRPKSVASTLTSPNGLYGIAVTDAGVVFTGPGTKIKMDLSGVVMTAASSRIEVKVDAINITTPGRLRVTDGLGNEIVTTDAGALRISGAAVLELGAPGATEITGGMVILNGCTGPVAVAGQSIVTTTGNPGAYPVQNGVPTVCAGG